MGGVQAHRGASMTLTKAHVLTPRLAELGYRVTQEGDRLCLWYQDDLVTFCQAGAAPGVLREAAWRHSFFRNLEQELEGEKIL